MLSTVSKVLSTLSFFWIATLQIAKAQMTCSQYFTYYKGHCYREMQQDGKTKEDRVALQNYQEAVNTCKAFGAYVVQIDSAEEGEWLLENKSRSGQPVWIGFDDITNEGTFEWQESYRCATGYTNWKTGEPNNYDNEDCADYGVSSETRGLWNDHKCNYRNHATVCEKLPEGVTDQCAGYPSSKTDWTFLHSLSPMDATGTGFRFEKPHLYKIVVSDTVPILQYRDYGTKGVAAKIGTVDITDYEGNGEFPIAGGDSCRNGNSRAGKLKLMCSTTESAHVEETSLCFYEVTWSSSAFC